MLNKECQYGYPGQWLFNIKCDPCGTFHPQYRFPCQSCKNGKVFIHGEFKICPVCKGKEYVEGNLK